MSTKKYVVKPGYAIKLDGIEYKGGEEIDVTEEQAESLHVESADQAHARLVLEGEASYEDDKTPVSDDLISKIEAAQSVETVEVLMSLSTTKKVGTAGKKRLKELEVAAAESNESDKITPEFLVERVKSAKFIEALDAIEQTASEKLETAGIDFVAKAIAARKKELGI